MEGITFGIEIETLVRPKLEDADIAQKFRSARWNDEEVLSLKEQRSNIEILQSLLVGELSRAGYPAHTKTQSYEKCTVDRDASIREPVEKDGSRRFGMIGSANTFAIKANISQVGLELISPVQEDIVQAMTEVTKVWEILLDIFQVKEDPSCSTHIHVGLKEGWSVSKLKGLAKGWLWFEPSFTNAVPSHRHNCIWAAPNHLCNWTEESAMTMQLYAEADERGHFASVFSYIDEADSIEELICRAAPGRLLAWNLYNTCKTCKTVEFRRPPQSLNAGDTMHWAKMAVFFVKWALEANFYDENSLEPRTNLESLIKRQEETLMSEGKT